MGHSSKAEPAGEDRLETLFSAHHAAIVLYCARRIGLGDAEDAASEVFAVAARRLEHESVENPRAWLYGVARGVLANQRRSADRRSRLQEAIARVRPSPQERPDEVVVRRSEDQRALDALRRLRPPDREVLMLAAWEELTAPEIASVLGISPGSAAQRLHRAKRRYEQSLARIELARRLQGGPR